MLPERFVIPLVDAANFGIEMPQGMLFVKLIEATGVPRMDLLSKSDPYVQCAPHAAGSAAPARGATGEAVKVACTQVHSPLQ